MHGGMWGVCGMYVDRYTYIYMYECIHTCMYEGRYSKKGGW